MLKGPYFFFILRCYVGTKLYINMFFHISLLLMLKHVSTVIAVQLHCGSSGMIISIQYADNRFRLVLFIKQLYHLDFG